MMEHNSSFFQELRDLASQGSAESRAKALWHATDLLIAGRYTEDQIWIFGEVIEQLTQAIEEKARAELAKRLAASDNAPVKVIHKLAFDDSIEVAGPVLRHSERLDERALVANAQTKSQGHLLAIAQRKVVSAPVTDVLVKRGDRTVVNSVTANRGAHFTAAGFLHLLKRSESDSILAENLGRRKDIPRHVFQQLIAKASEDVRKRLESERPEFRGEIQNAVTDVTGALHAKFGPASKDYFAAKRIVGAQHRAGQLREQKLLEYAQARKFYECVVALSLMCALPVDVAERALVEDSREALLIIAKSLDLSWTTTMSLLFLGATNHQISGRDLDLMSEKFVLLSVETSVKIMEVYRTRKAKAAECSEFQRLPQLHAN